MNSSLKITKLFIGGLSTDTTEGNLHSYFKKYGQLNECKLIIDKYTNNSKGFAFLSFEDCSIHEKVIQMEHNIDGRIIECKYAYTKEGKQYQSRLGNYSHHNNNNNNNNNDEKQYSNNNFNRNNNFSQHYIENNKMFVGGIHHLVTEDEMGQYFCYYGEIERLVILKDPNTGKSRGFGFVFFEDSNSIDQVLSTNSGHYLRNKKIECKRATPKNSSLSSSCNQIELINHTTCDYHRLNHNNNNSLSSNNMHYMNNSFSLGNDEIRSLYLIPKENYYFYPQMSSFQYDSSKSPNPYDDYPPDRNNKCFNSHLYYKLYDKQGIKINELLSKKKLNQNKKAEDIITKTLPLVNRKTNECDLSTSSEYAENNNEEKKSDKKRSVIS